MQTVVGDVWRIFHLLQATCIVNTKPECQSSDLEFIPPKFVWWRYLDLKGK